MDLTEVSILIKPVCALYLSVAFFLHHLPKFHPEGSLIFLFVKVRRRGGEEKVRWQACGKIRR